MVVLFIKFLTLWLSVTKPSLRRLLWPALQFVTISRKNLQVFYFLLLVNQSRFYTPSTMTLFNVYLPSCLLAHEGKRETSRQWCQEPSRLYENHPLSFALWGPTKEWAEILANFTSLLNTSLRSLLCKSLYSICLWASKQLKTRDQLFPRCWVRRRPVQSCRSGRHSPNSPLKKLQRHQGMAPSQHWGF